MFFFWMNQLYRFRVLPFGLASAPRIFTKVLKPVYALFRQNGIRCCYYIDDSLIMNQIKEKCSAEASLVSKQLDDLGFTINFKKSVFHPTQRIVFFGLIIDTVEFKVFLTEEKIEKILSLCHYILDQKTVTIRKFASLIGLFVHAFHAILPGPLHYRNLEKDKTYSLKGTNDFDLNMIISHQSIVEIHWWVANIRPLNGKPIRPESVKYWLETDASRKGWGACFGNLTASGRWTIQESNYHINYLELLSVFYALKAFFSKYRKCHICIKSDNTTTVSYINNMGGMTSDSLNNLAVQIWNWCLDRDIFLSSQHIPGISNIQADQLSRKFSDNLEWKLKEEIFRRICQQTFLPKIDLFASRHNAQLPVFASLNYDPDAKFTNAFSVSWSDLEPYLFPPFCLISKVIQKVLTDNVDQAILIVPFWPTQNWFSLLISALISPPFRLPRHRDLLYMPLTGEIHPLSKKIVLVACVLSRKYSKIKDFQTMKLKSSCPPGSLLRINSMDTVGKNGSFGVINGKLINFNRLK